MKRFAWLVSCLSLITLSCAAQSFDAFKSGKAIPAFGKIAPIDSDLPIPEGTEFNIVFDVATQATPGKINRTLDSAARFINMHVDAGVPAKNIRLAVVVHGGASADLTRDAFYTTKTDGVKNANADAIATLLEHGTEIYLCGQTAAYYGIGKKDLLPGVSMALSAMTAHALLLQKGYTPNPF